MAKAQYVGVDGVARKVKKNYIGADGVARSVKKAYVGVEGVARQYFMSGVKWSKYSCTQTSDTGYVRKYDTVGNAKSEYKGVLNMNYFSSYTFSSTKGFLNAGTAWWNNTDYNAHIGHYVIPSSVHISNGVTTLDGGEIVYKLESVDFLRDETHELGVLYQFNYTIEADSTKSTTYLYSKGSTSYGTITAESGELPEDGTLMDGSAYGGYCVLKIGTSYYYYILEE